MSSFFMVAIALMYLGAAVSFGVDGKWQWSIVASCWGLGNAVLAYISK